MHSTSIVKDLHDKSTSTVRLVYQDAIFDTKGKFFSGVKTPKKA